MAHIMDSDIKIITDTHTTQFTVDNLRKELADKEKTMDDLVKSGIKHTMKYG